VISPDLIDAVVFDMGGVFVIPAPTAISDLVSRTGVPLELDDAAARRAHYSGVAAITVAVAECEVDESHPSLWEAYDGAFFESAGLSGEALQTAMTVRHSERLTGDTAAIWNHPLPENVGAFVVVAELRPVAVVTNNNGTAVQQCIDLEICQVGPGPLPEVVAIVDSGVLGIAKPDPRIFAPALDALGTHASRTLYVGDTVHADVRGATAAGMPVVQLDPFGFHAGHSHWRLPDVVALAAHLR
jgi:putative hydrolase of the HAD superfamily